MNPEIVAAFFEAILAKSRPEYIQLKPAMWYTRNLFGRLSDIEGKRVKVMERNQDGDCICIIENEQGVAQYLVDVDHRDIKD